MNKDRHIPLYEKLFSFYRDRIIEHKYQPGDQIDSISQMMLKHSVSRETAKLVLNLLEEESLVTKIRGKGSFVMNIATPLNKWALILPMFTSNMEQLISIALKEAGKAGQELDYFFHYNNPEEEMRLVGTLMRDGYSSILIVPNFNEALTAEFYRRLIPLRRNVLLLDYTMAGSYFNYVIQSYDLGIKRAVDYLLERSKGNLVLVKNNIWKGRNLLAELMESAFTGYISGHNIDNHAFILEEHGDLSLEFIRRENITGIICCQDTDALKVYSRLGRAGLNVPRELKLVNYGKTELLELVENKISYIDCKYEKMIEKVCDIILEKQNKSQLEQHVIFPELIIRDT